MMFQCILNALVSLTVEAVHVWRGPGAKAPAGTPVPSWRWLDTLGRREVVLTSVVYVMAMYMSNEALAYVTYPTQALAKSCKMIPVLIGRVVINGERYGLIKYLCVLLMTIGIALFQLSAGKKRMSNEGFGGEGFGMSLLVISLVLDGVSGPFQEKLKMLGLNNTQQIVVNNFWAASLMLAMSLGYGEFFSTVRRS